MKIRISMYQMVTIHIKQKLQEIEGETYINIESIREVKCLNR